MASLCKQPRKETRTHMQLSSVGAVAKPLSQAEPSCGTSAGALAIAKQFQLSGTLN